jgi:thiol-disulfide isomerase/thioredoxin
MLRRLEDPMHPLSRLSVTVMLSLAAFCATARTPKAGEPAPAIEATTWDGGHFSLAAERGRVVIVHFWASWCTPCRLEMPVLDAYYRQHHDAGVDVLAINLDDKEGLAEARAAMTAFAYPAASYRDARAPGYGRIVHLPLTFVIDRDGILRRDAWTAAPVVDAAVLEREVTPLVKAAH